LDTCSFDIESKNNQGNLPRDISEREFREKFEKFGGIVRCNLKAGFGFVEFKDTRDAEDAIKDCDGTSLAGNKIKVEWAKGERRRNGDRGRGGKSEGCFNCGKTGHFARNCRNRRSDGGRSRGSYRRHDSRDSSRSPRRKSDRDDYDRDERRKRRSSDERDNRDKSSRDRSPRRSPRRSSRDRENNPTNNEPNSAGHDK